LRAYIEQVFSAAKFLRYGAREQELVDRVVMNFHPNILAHAAFIDRPRTLKELYQVVGIVEEKLAVAREAAITVHGHWGAQPQGCPPFWPRAGRSTTEVLDLW
jgi:hypothetical protein